MRLLTYAILPSGHFYMQAAMVGVTDEEFDAMLTGGVPPARIQQVSKSVHDHYSMLLNAEPMGHC